MQIDDMLEISRVPFSNLPLELPASYHSLFDPTYLLDSNPLDTCPSHTSASGALTYCSLNHQRFSIFVITAKREFSILRKVIYSLMAPKLAENIVIRSTRKVVQASTVQVSVVSSSKRSTRANKDTEDEGNTLTQDRVRTIPVQEVTPQAPPENASDTRKDPEEKTEQENTQNAGKPIKKGTEGKDDRNKGMKRKRKKGGRSGEGYRRYVYRVLKQVHPELRISFQAMTILNNLMTDMFERLADEVMRLKTHTGHMTLSSRGIQGAVKLVLPGELGKHAIAEGAKAVTNYMSSDARN